MPPKIIYSFIFLPVILLIGAVSSCGDFKDSKIKNKWILTGLIYSFGIYLISWVLYAAGLSGPYLLWNFDKWCINLLISMLVSYFLWHFKMWGAGDAKLFICYAALIPLGQYSRVYFNYYFASFLLLLAIFIPATLFLVVKSGIYFMGTFSFSKAREKLPRLIQEKSVKFNKIEVAKVLLGFFLFFLFFRVARECLGNLFGGKALANQNFLIFLSLVAFRPLSNLFRKNIKLIAASLIILIIYIVFERIYSWQQFILEIRNILGKSILLMVLFPLLKKIVDLYTERVTQKAIPLAIWMLLGTLITWFL